VVPDAGRSLQPGSRAVEQLNSREELDREIADGSRNPESIANIRRTEPMNLQTPLRVFRALGETASRRRYRSALRDRVWRGLASLPFSVTLNATLRDSLRIRINSRDTVISRSIFATGEWEPAELDFIRTNVKPGMVAVDVGANIGAHTLTLAQCVGAHGRVHAFEPTRVFDTLSHNVRQNGFTDRTKLNHCAVGDRDGTIRLLSCKPGLELFTSREIPLVPEASTGEYADYPLVTLDSYASMNHIDSIDFLKVDVEGAEELVFRGCAGLFARKAIGCIMFELNEVCMTGVGDSPSSLVGLIRSAGYRLATFDAAGRFRPLPESMTGVFNVVAVRESAPLSSQYPVAFSSTAWVW
jgi:FkbM family methyltransferase